MVFRKGVVVTCDHVPGLRTSYWIANDNYTNMNTYLSRLLTSEDATAWTSVTAEEIHVQLSLGTLDTGSPSAIHVATAMEGEFDPIQGFIRYSDR